MNSYRVIHAFTSAGVLPSQYCHFSTFAGLGRVGGAYIKHGQLSKCKVFQSALIVMFFSVYEKSGYMDLVAKQADSSMKSAIEEVKALPTYTSIGEVHFCFI